MIEIKPWVKPHLRARLIEEEQAKQPKTAQGLTPIEPNIPPSPGPIQTQRSVCVGDIVKIKKPRDPLEYPEWSAAMDSFDNKEVTVIDVINTRFGRNYRLIKILEDQGAFVYNTDWIA